MPVNYQTPAASQLKPVRGVRLGIAEAGIRKVNRKDLLLIELAHGLARCRSIHSQSILRRAGAGLPASPRHNR